jgi:hypothetical protein
MSLLPYEKAENTSAKLFESKIAHGETRTANTLNQITGSLVRL